VSSSLTAALQAALAADSPLVAACPGGVWVDPAPDGVTEPFVVVEQTFGFDEGVGGGPRHSRVTYEVCAVAPAAQVASVRTAAARLDALLDYELGYTALTGYRVLGCRRTAPVDVALEEVTGRYVKVGGEYTLWVTAA
jgi:hypothetical protein